MNSSERDALAEAIFQAADEKHFGVMGAVLKVCGQGEVFNDELAAQYVIEASEAHGMVRAARIVQQWPVTD